MGALVLDASVVIGLFDPADAHHAAAAQRVRERRDAGDGLVLPASAWAESLVGAFRRGQGEAVELLVRGLIAEPRPIDRDVAVAAAKLRSVHPALRLPDALVLATAEVDDADVLTADHRWAGYSERVEVLA